MFLSIHAKPRDCLNVGQSGALLTQSEENKERWRAGRKGWRKSQKRGRQCVFQC